MDPHGEFVPLHLGWGSLLLLPWYLLMMDEDLVMGKVRG